MGEANIFNEYLKGEIGNFKDFEFYFVIIVHACIIFDCCFI